MLPNAVPDGRADNNINKMFTAIDINSVAGNKLSSVSAGSAINELGQRTSINF